MTEQEIAAALGWSVSEVRETLASALEKIFSGFSQARCTAREEGTLTPGSE